MISPGNTDLLKIDKIEYRPMDIITAMQLKAKQDIQKKEDEKFFVAVTPEGCLCVMDEVEQSGANYLEPK